MYQLQKIPDYQKINFKTLHKDIGLEKRSNGQWDIWFNNGDLVSATEFHSLQVGIIISCLTSWNYMNRYGNPTYEIFGNESYSLLKENKSEMVRFKIKAYFTECLERMRRVDSVEYLNVLDIDSNPYMYHVVFKVRSMSDYLISGEFDISIDNTKSSSYISYDLYMPYVSANNPLVIDLWLKNEYGGGISDEIVYMYINDSFVGIKGKTDKRGYIRIVQQATDFNPHSTIQFKYRGNVNYNPVESEIYTFQSVPIYFDVDENGILYISTTDGGHDDEFFIAEIMSGLDVPHSYLEKENLEWKKVYLVHESGISYRICKIDIVNGQRQLSKTSERVNITKDLPTNIGDIHLMVKTQDDIYILNKDNHLYYVGE